MSGREIRRCSVPSCENRHKAHGYCTVGKTPVLGMRERGKGGRTKALKLKRPKPPKVLDAIADVVLRYKPKPVSAAAKKRKRAKRKVEKKK